MGYQPNGAFDANAAESRIANPVLSLFGPSTAANLGGGVYSVPQGCDGDIYFTIAGLSSETVTVKISFDNTNYSAALTVVDSSTGKDTASTNLGNGTYVMPMLRFGSPMQIKFTKSSTTETAAVAIASASLVSAW